MKKEIKHTAMVLGGYVKQNLEEKLKAWMDWTLFGKTKSNSDDAVKGGYGTSEYTTYVIGPCITRLYKGQKDI